MKQLIIMCLATSLLFLSACSVSPEASQDYRVEQPLQADLTFPEEMNTGEEVTFQVNLRQSEQAVTKPDFVHVEIYKADGSLTYGMQETAVKEDGVYVLNQRFKEDGLYIARVHAQAKGSLIYPSKQFIVGKLTDEEWAALYEGADSIVEPSSEPHH